MEIYDETVFGTGDGPIWDMETITCNGDEDHLEDCASDGGGLRRDGDVDHSRDISMMCRPYESIGTIEARLVDFGDEISRGRLEIHLGGGIWGSVCSSEGWGYAEAEVVCRQLSFGSGLHTRILSASEFPTSYGPIGLSNVDCDSNESNLRECNHGAWGRYDCGHDQDVGIDCYYYDDGEPDEPSAGIPTWEIILIAFMGLTMLLILTGLAIYQRGRKRRRVSSPVHSASQRDHQDTSNPSYEMTAEPPPEYRPRTPPPIESPPSYESVTVPPYKQDGASDDGPPKIEEDYHHDRTSNNERAVDRNPQIPRGLFQRTDSTYV